MPIRQTTCSTNINVNDRNPSDFTAAYVWYLVFCLCFADAAAPSFTFIIKRITYVKYFSMGQRNTYFETTQYAVPNPWAHHTRPIPSTYTHECIKRFFSLLFLRRPSLFHIIYAWLWLQVCVVAYGVFIFKLDWYAFNKFKIDKKLQLYSSNGSIWIGAEITSIRRQLSYDCDQSQ